LGEQATQIGIFQPPDANALDLLGAIDAELAASAERFPAGVDYEIGFDTSKFVEAAVREVVITLGQAILLVVLVVYVYVFLQKGRTTVIPSLAIPIALVGAFGFMFVFGFSVDQLPLLGLILAVGLVVDDAIVVVENVERHLAAGEDRATATLSAMREVLGPILATTAVRFALFVPVAFIPGISGRLYSRLVTRLVGMRGVVAVVMLVVVGGTAALFVQRPTGFVPAEDQGYFIVNVQLPEAASFQRTRDVVFALEDRLVRAPGVADVVAVAGRRFVGNVDAPYFGFLIAIMADWSVRGPDRSVEAVIAGLRPELAARQDASIQVFNAPPLPGVGSTGAVRLQFRGLDFQEPAVMAREAGAFIAALKKRGEAGRTFTAGLPRLDFELKRERAERAGVEIARLFDSTQAFLDAAFVNEFARFGGPTASSPRPRPRPGTSRATSPIGRCATEPAPGVSSGELVAAVEATAAEHLGTDFGFEWTGSVFQQKQAGGWAPMVFALAVVFVVVVLAAQFESPAMPMVAALAVPFAILGAMAGLAVAGLDFDVFGPIGVLMLVGLSAKNAFLIVQLARDQQDAGREPVEAAVEAARLPLRPILMTAFSFVLEVLPLALSTDAGANARTSPGATVVGGMTAATVLSLLLVPASKSWSSAPAGASPTEDVQPAGTSRWTLKSRSASTQHSRVRQPPRSASAANPSRVYLWLFSV
jgi:HAE1 family hydrophobic/amphiphilic exporter-1